MIDDDRFCYEILMQISAISHSLKSASNQIFMSHLSVSVANDIKNENMEIVDDVIDLIKILN